MQSLRIYVVSLLVFAVLLPYIGGVQNVLAIVKPIPNKVEQIILDKGESKIEDNLYQAIYNLLTNEGNMKFKSQAYYVDSVNKEGGWALISISKLNKTANINLEGTYLGDNILILATTPDNGVSWDLSFENDLKFKEKIAKTPDSFLNKVSKDLLISNQSSKVVSASTLALASTTSIYKFPWPELNTKTYSKGWHGTTIGVDLGSASTNRTILASGTGVVTRVSLCTYSVNVTVKHPDGKIFNYLHLNKNEFDTTKIKNGIVISQGKKLGRLRTGSFDDKCGYAIQNTNYSHIHWALPTNVTNTIDQWSIKYAGNCWTKPGYANRCVGSSFGSTNKEIV